MTVAGLVCAILVGATIGLLGKVVFLRQWEAPTWLTITVGVVAAVAGTIVARLAGAGTSAPDPLVLIVQVGMAGVGVALVVTTAGSPGPTPQVNPEPKRRPR